MATWGPEEVVHVGEHALRVVRAGEGRPLLLINGIGASAEMWAPFVAHLRDHSLLALDLPGVGSSPPSPWPLRIPALADLVANLLERIDAPPVDVLGYSFGGAVVQELAHRHPDRVRRLVLCATSAGLGSIPPRPMAGLSVLTPARYQSRALGRLIMPWMVGGRTRRDAAVLEDNLNHRLQNPPHTLGYLQQLYAFTGWSSGPWLRRIRQRTLIVHGEEDPLVPVANARNMASMMRDAQLYVVAGGGHLLLLDEPGSVVPELTQFLARNGTAAH